MSRELKFRVFDEEYGIMFLNPNKEWFGRVFSTSNTLMQFTGLKDKKDKKNKEIYDGDIVMTMGSVLGGEKHKFPCEVKFKNHGWVMEGNGLYCINKTCEVVGNIYEDKLSDFPESDKKTNGIHN